MVGRGIRESEEMEDRGHKGRETEEGRKGVEWGRGRGHQPYRAYPAPRFLCIIFSRKCCKSKSR